MTDLIGMDAGEVRRLAGHLQAQANALQSVVGGIDAIVHQMAQSWHGADATEFAGWWQQQHRPALTHAHQSLAGLAQSATNNATQQDHASGIATGVAVTAVAAAPLTHGAVVQVGAVAATAAAAGAVATSAARDAAVQGFVAAYPVGETVGSGQCVALFEAYSEHYVHTQAFALGPYGDGACDLYTRFNDIPGLKEAYTQLPASTVPQPGDVAVWDSSTPYSDGYGHVAIVTGTTGSTVHILQQNYEPLKVSDGSYPAHGEPHLLGYLRPKNLG